MTKEKPKSAIDLWAGFLAHEKLTPERVGPANTVKLLALCETLAKDGPPNWLKTYAMRLEARRKVCNAAMDTGIDLSGWKKGNTQKVAMGRGLLDIWNEVYAKRFGSTVGTAVEAELRRRKIVTKMSAEGVGSKTVDLPAEGLKDDLVRVRLMPLSGHCARCTRMFASSPSSQYFPWSVPIMGVAKEGSICTFCYESEDKKRPLAKRKMPAATRESLNGFIATGDSKQIPAILLAYLEKFPGTEFKNLPLRWQKAVESLVKSGDIRVNGYRLFSNRKGKK